MTGQWAAKWVSFSQHPDGDSGVFAFRRRLVCDVKPKSHALRVSADQRYRLYVNGRLVGHGPQRGDLLHWHYETYDVAPYLKKGSNWIVVLVWHLGRYAPMAQHSARLGLVVETHGASTPDGWEVSKIPGWGYDMLHSQVGPFYIDVGPGEIMDAKRLGWGFEKGSNAGLKWLTPNEVCDAVERGGGGGGTPWMLAPRTIPAMLYQEREREYVVRSGDAASVGRERPVILDYGELLTAYPRICVSGPAKAKVTVTYAESFFGKGGDKGNRDEIEGKEMWGYQDVLVLDGKERTFEPLWWRTFRYVRIESDAEVCVKSVKAIETGYPYAVESSFIAEGTSPIWDVSVRTAKRCAGEHYFDCPYYEQLQYAGDTRIQALIGYYLSTDRALQRNAVDQLAQSAMPDGLTQSRYPSRQAQVIPPFSLWWVMMLYDQWLYDRKPIPHRHIEIAEGILAAWDRLSDNSFWTFADWVPTWPWGEPPGRARASVHVFTRWMAEIALAQILGDGSRIEAMRRLVVGVERTEGGLAFHKDDPVHQPSEHAEALYRICQQMLGLHADPWPDGALHYAAKCTYYFSYYKHLAKSPADYLSELEPWHEMVRKGLTTFAESPEPTRSDCHAWSAHPILGLFQIVAGVTSMQPGWRKARIAPRPGRLRSFEARIAHPDGPLAVSLAAGRLIVESPVPFELVWADQVKELGSGKHFF